MSSKSKKSSRSRVAARQPAPGQGLPLVPIALIALAALALVGAAVIILRPPSPSVASTNTGTNLSQSVATPAPAATQPASSGAGGSTRSPQRTPVTAQDGAVRLPVAQFDDRVARFYTYQAGSKTIPFFVLKGSDGTLRAAFDACDVCYSFKKGYHQEGDVMVCNNCGNRFPSVRINIETGGCNPGPLKMTVQGDAVVIQPADIQAGARYF